MKLRIRNHLLLFYHYNIRKCVGISSKVKGSDDLHYLLFDIDNPEDCQKACEWVHHNYPSATIMYESSPNGGCHIFVFYKFSWRGLLNEMLYCPYIDLNWYALGIKRGYFFLETRHKLAYPDVTYMRVDRIA